MNRQCLILFLVSSMQLQGEVDFQHQIRPILANHCFRCHGPDEQARKADLRLDLRPDQSIFPKILTRIHHASPDELMPPPAAKKPLLSSHKKVLKQWVREGAVYTEHWAFIRPKALPLPKTKQSSWLRNDLDRFILSSLEGQGLKPSVEAGRHRLIRRLSLDLIGLPPKPDEIQAFIKDKRPYAYERLVDRLLARSEYGERWAQPWLDLARYADTNGYEKDRPRSIWPWRDWVINALNKDMPFDQFTIEQIAGDMLPSATQSQRVATGFHRNTMVNEEGGIDPLEFRFYAMVDRVNTTATTWLGLTFGCAQCHTHKFDPVPHRAYYEMMAFLNNTHEPEIPVCSPEQERQRISLQKQIANQLSSIPVDEEKFELWLQSQRAKATPWRTITPNKMNASIGWLELLEDQSIFARGDMRKHDTYKFEFFDLPADITALRLEALPDKRLPKGGPGRAYYEGPKGDFFLSELVLVADGQPVEIATGTVNYAKQWIGSGKPGAMKALDGDLQTGWSASGREGKPSQAVWQLAEPLTATSLKLRMDFSRHYSASLGRFRFAVAKCNEPPEAKDLPASIESILAKPNATLSQEEMAALRLFYVEKSKEMAKARKHIEAQREQLLKPPTTLVMQERPGLHLRNTYRHHRGEFLSPREAVFPKVPPFLPPLEKGIPHNRLGFAQWLVDENNPLTARVVVNRHWAALFGEGIVRTTDDFGYTGTAPSYPELLDWLALEFMRLGWSQKKIHRLIVTSATYRQSQGARFRLPVEQIRDAALSVSGLLSLRFGGASIYPPQPKSVSEGIYGGGGWRTSSGADRYRRGLYIFTKRTMPFATDDTFDAPSGEQCVAKRDVSNTPLQALTLLNDVVFVEASRALGQAVAAQQGSITDLANAMFERCLSRPPDAHELQFMIKFYRAQLTRFRNNELNAAKLLGEGGPDENERAAWVALARTLLNTNEFITRN